MVTEWYQPVDRDRRLFVAAQGLFGSDFIDGRDADGEPLRFRQQGQSAGFDIGARIWQAGEVRVDCARGFSLRKTAILNPGAKVAFATSKKSMKMEVLGRLPMGVRAEALRRNRN